MTAETLKFLYANFQGRIGRKTFWFYFVLPILLFNIMLERSQDYFAENELAGLVILAIGVLFFIAMVSGFVKRLHDRGKSGWWVLLCMIPVIGTIYWVIDCGLLAGKDEDNEYGEPAPLQLEKMKNAKA